MKLKFVQKQSYQNTTWPFAAASVPWVFGPRGHVPRVSCSLPWVQVQAPRCPRPHVAQLTSWWAHALSLVVASGPFCLRPIFRHFLGEGVQTLLLGSEGAFTWQESSSSRVQRAGGGTSRPPPRRQAAVALLPPVLSTVRPLLLGRLLSCLCSAPGHFSRRRPTVVRGGGPHASCPPPASCPMPPAGLWLPSQPRLGARGSLLPAQLAICLQIPGPRLGSPPPQRGRSGGASGARG